MRVHPSNDRGWHKHSTVRQHYCMSVCLGRRAARKKSGDYSEEDTPVPIPNTVVKLFSAEDTWRATSREIRTSPVFLFFIIFFNFLFIYIVVKWFIYFFYFYGIFTLVPSFLCIFLDHKNSVFDKEILVIFFTLSGGNVKM